MDPIESVLAKHDTELALLQAGAKSLEDWAGELTKRTQLLVDQFHAQNVVQAAVEAHLIHIRKTLDAINLALEHDFVLQPEFKEIKGEWRKFLSVVLLSVLATALAGLSWIGHRFGL